MKKTGSVVSFLKLSIIDPLLNENEYLAQCAHTRTGTHLREFLFIAYQIYLGKLKKYRKPVSAW